MASGNHGAIKLTTDGFEMEIAWSEQYDIERNTSNVRIDAVKVLSSWWHGFTYYADGIIKINGVPVITMNSNQGTHSVRLSSLNEYATVNQNGSPATGGTEVAHNSDGSKTVTIEVSGNRFSKCAFYSSGGGGGSGFGFTGSTTVALSTIPRATAPKLSHSNIDMGAQMTVDLSGRASASFTHSVHICPKATGQWQTVISKTSSPKPVFNVPDFASSLPNDTSGVVTLTVKTYNGNTLIGEKSTSFTATVPSKYVPSISVAAKEGALSGYSALIQNHSKIETNITAAGAAGSTVTEISSVFDGVRYSGAHWTSQPIRGYGNLEIRSTVKDSRGRINTVITNVTVMEYSNPSISLLRADRCNADHNLNPSGECARILYSYAISCAQYGVTASMAIKYKVRSAQLYNTLTVGSDISASESSYFSNVVFQPEKSFDIQLEVRDSLGGSANVSVVLPTEQVVMDVKSDGTGVAFGKIIEQSRTMEADWNLDMLGHRVGNVGKPESEEDAAPISFIRFGVEPDTPGMFGEFGCVWSKFGNTFNKAGPDNYYIGQSVEGNLWGGYQVNGRKDIVWFKHSGVSTIVAEGDSGGWHWRKWKNGFAECWQVLDFTFNNYLDKVGQFFRYSLELTYPFPFIPKQWSKPFFNATVDSVHGLVTQRWTDERFKKFSGYVNTFIQYGANNATGVSIYVSGYWK